MKRFILFGALVVMSCSLFQVSGPDIPATAKAAIELTQTALPAQLASSPIPAATPVLPPTSAPVPSPVAAVTEIPAALEFVVPTAGVLPQQWNGYYIYPTGQKQGISLLIEKVDGATFKGKMIWQSFGKSRGAILKMNGEYVTDFGDGAELVKWKNLEDYSEVHREGTWLKWTETEQISGSNYTVNGWYYAHIRQDGTMVAVYYFNKDETTPDSGSFIFSLVSR